jgi:hypothetical protein
MVRTMRFPLPGAALVLLTAAAVAGFASGSAHAQADDNDLQIFGYFQARFLVEKQVSSQESVSSFSLQQLNIFLRKPINARWSSFVNFEAVNSYASDLGWGSFRLEEAWVGYRGGPSFQLRMGLLIPRFNRLNEIKNRMPLLPYIVRPIVYESSLSEVVSIEEYVPQRAYAQANGYFTVDRVKLDYAVYTGNSVHVNGDPTTNVTGVDSTGMFMVGGRVGLRHKDTMLGVSLTGDEVDLVDFFPGLPDSIGVSEDRLDGVVRTRLGLDFSTTLRRVALETEYIKVMYHEDIGGFNIDKSFGYVTLGYHFTDRWFGYASYWRTVENFWTTPYGVPGERTFTIDGVGVSYAFNDRITFKGQYGEGKYETDIPNVDLSEFDFGHGTVAVSVFF